jgi:hypothetical protein
LEIKPTRLVKGQGLARLLAESKCKEFGVNFMNIDSKNQQVEIASEESHIGSKLERCP